MLDRQLFGDVVLAVLIAVPVSALARPEAGPHRDRVTLSAPEKKNASVALAPAAVRQTGIFR